MLNSKHPLYAARLPDWTLMFHASEGVRAIKEQREVYLPATAGMRADGMSPHQPGWLAYEAYLKRAVFPSDTGDAIESLVGLMNRKSAKIELPAALEPIRERATSQGESLDTLLRRIHENQLKYGRLGLMADVPTGAGPEVMPYIASYLPTAIINWDVRRVNDGPEELAFVVLDESRDERQADLTWKAVKRYRIVAFPDQVGKEGTAPVIGKVVDGDDLALAEWVTPSLGGKTLTSLPFVVVNVQDLAPAPDKPPLLGLANKCLDIYRGEADYRQSLYLQGQETLVISGDEGGLDPNSKKDETRVGAGAVLRLPQGGKAEYVGVSSSGLGEQRQALDADYARAAQIGMRLHDATEGASGQSGDALATRVAARTASLVSIAKAAAAGLQAILRVVAEFKGADPDEGKVEANTDFADNAMTGRELVDWQTAYNLGAPISKRTIHQVLQAREITTLTYEEEMALRDEEAALDTSAPTGKGAPVDNSPGGPNDQGQQQAPGGNRQQGTQQR